MNAAAIAAAALAAARDAGCTCEPEITLHDARGDVLRAQLAHDDWCPLLRAQDTTPDAPRRTLAIIAAPTATARP